MRETVVEFGSAARLVGILTSAEQSVEAARRPAVVLLDSGLIHRVAPGRLYVRLARELARRGHDALRFDFSGIGDSSVRSDAMGVEQSGVAETREALDHLAEANGHHSFVLLGLCGGGYFSFRTALSEPRVSGLVLLNVRGHLSAGDDEASERIEARAMKRHYRRIARAASYRRKNVLKVLRGQFDIRGALGSLRRSPRRERLEPEPPRDADLLRLAERRVRLLHVYSEGDWSVDYLWAALGEDYEARLCRDGSDFEYLRGTNHVFTPAWSSDLVVRTVADWLDRTTFTSET